MKKILAILLFVLCTNAYADVKEITVYQLRNYMKHEYTVLSERNVDSVIGGNTYSAMIQCGDRLIRVVIWYWYPKRRFKLDVAVRQQQQEQFWVIRSN